DAGAGASMADAADVEAGASLAADGAEACAAADIVMKVRKPIGPGAEVAGQADEVAQLKSGAVLICLLEPFQDRPLIDALAARGVTAFALEMIPRITRAQSMDVLSSQANVAGYKAVLDAIDAYGRAVPMMSTAAGRVVPAQAFIMGVGVAGLQAIATAKRLGAVVSATDVRPATKEQVESLGGTFVAVENEEFLQAQTDGGYAKEMSDDYKRQQADLVAQTITKMDIVITTALIPGRPAPVLVTEDHIKSMKPGAVVVDLAAEAGGNCPLTKVGKVVRKHGVTIIGHGNWPSRVPETTSQLYARNLLNFLTPLWDPEAKALTLNREDEIVAGAMVTEGGAVVHPALAAAEGA
ncbi:MAG: NAD(P) transhydrogenase subunit alpha, partial [Pseudomonadota bacterium]|nr:NAD(P) transhydrogenase subunit alpha [Pseudomonadota bacterium]